MSKEYIDDQVFENIDFRLNPLPIGEYSDCQFSKCSFENCNLSGITFADCEFTECDMSNATALVDPNATNASLAVLLNATNATANATEFQQYRDFFTYHQNVIR